MITTAKGGGGNKETVTAMYKENHDRTYQALINDAILTVAAIAMDVHDKENSISNCETFFAVGSKFGYNSSTVIAKY